MIKVVEKIKTNFSFQNFFSPKIVFFNEIMWKKMTDTDRQHMTNVKTPMRFACCITKATDTYNI
jgi:hypothetical protein